MPELELTEFKKAMDLDGMELDTTLVYEVPAGYVLILKEVVLLCTYQEHVADGPVVSIGKTGPNYTDFASGVEVGLITQGQAGKVELPAATTTGAPWLTAGDKVYLKVDTAATPAEGETAKYSMAAVFYGDLVAVPEE